MDVWKKRSWFVNGFSLCLGLEEHGWREVALIAMGLLSFTVMVACWVRRSRRSVKLERSSRERFKRRPHADVSQIVAKPCRAEAARRIGGRRYRCVRRRRARKRWLGVRFLQVLSRLSHCGAALIRALRCRWKELREGHVVQENLECDAPLCSSDVHGTMSSVQKSSVSSSLEVLSLGYWLEPVGVL